MQIISQQPYQPNQPSFKGVVKTSSLLLLELKEEFAKDTILLSKNGSLKSTGFVVDPEGSVRISIQENMARPVVDFILDKGQDCYYMAKHNVNTVKDILKLKFDPSHKVEPHNIHTVI